MFVIKTTSFVLAGSYFLETLALYLSATTVNWAQYSLIPALMYSHCACFFVPLENSVQIPGPAPGTCRTGIFAKKEPFSIRPPQKTLPGPLCFAALRTQCLVAFCLMRSQQWIASSRPRHLLITLYGGLRL